jgi:secondary thiamine-phosphate synthase enzyme
MPDAVSETLFVSSRSCREFLDITGRIQSLVEKHNITHGIAFLFLPHTTAALTLNENWDPDVPRDILLTLSRHTSPPDPEHRHEEGNSPAHVQSSLVGESHFLFIEDGRLKLGSWQGVFLAEFDGPRERKVFVKFLYLNSQGIPDNPSPATG